MGNTVIKFPLSDASNIAVVLPLLDFINSLNTKVPPYRNQSIDVQSKSLDWFLYDSNLRV